MAETQKAPEVKGPDVVAYEGDTLYLLGSRCPACGAAFYPPQAVCARCGHRGFEDLKLGPTGTIYTYTRVHQSTPEFRTPYVLVFVDFPQEVRVLMPLAEGAEPVIGERVELVMEEGPRMADGQGVSLVHARPARKEEGR